MAWGYIAEYQGLPISRLKDVLAGAQEILYELGVHFEAIASQATAAHFIGINKNGAIFPHFRKQQPVE